MGCNGGATGGFGGSAGSSGGFGGSSALVGGSNGGFGGSNGGFGGSHGGFGGSSALVGGSNGGFGGHGSSGSIANCRQGQSCNVGSQYNPYSTGSNGGFSSGQGTLGSILQGRRTASKEAVKLPGLKAAETVVHRTDDGVNFG